jgi:hypothetical protein
VSLPTSEFADLVVGSTIVGAAHRGVERSDSPLGPGGDLLGGVVPCRGARLTDLVWRQPTLAAPNATARLTMTITRWRAESAAGRVHGALRLVGAADELLASGESKWEVPGAQGTATPERIAWDVGSLAWGRRIADELGKDPAFASTTATFDGTIGIASGDDEIHLRIYRGAIIEVAPKALAGSTFTVWASELTWVEMLQSPRLDYVRRASSRQFTTRGNSFEYLRMFKALMLLVEQARANVAEQIVTTNATEVDDA